MKLLACASALVLLVSAGVLSSQTPVCQDRSEPRPSPNAQADSKVKDIKFDKLPSFFLFPKNDEYKVDPYIKVASQLQKLGKKEALETLKKATTPNESDDTFAILTRMLFSAKPKGKFRTMILCQLWGYYGGTSQEDWPLQPIEIIDGVPFLIVNCSARVGSGWPEPTSDYLDYCIKDCDWSATEFKPLNAEQKKNALNKLLASKKWKVPLTDEEKKMFEAQIK
jgi:hypothetical protein